MQVEVKTSPSPLPDGRRDAEWKLSYRKIASTGIWSIHVCVITRLFSLIMSVVQHVVAVMLQIMYVEMVIVNYICYMHLQVCN